VAKVIRTTPGDATNVSEYGSKRWLACGVWDEFRLVTDPTRITTDVLDGERSQAENVQTAVSAGEAVVLRSLSTGAHKHAPKRGDLC